MLPVLGYPRLLRGCDTGPRASTWRKETRRAHPEPSPGARATADGGSQCPPTDRPFFADLRGSCAGVAHDDAVRRDFPTRIRRSLGRTRRRHWQNLIQMMMIYIYINNINCSYNPNNTSKVLRPDGSYMPRFLSLLIVYNCLPRLRGFLIVKQLIPR